MFESTIDLFEPCVFKEFLPETSEIIILFFLTVRKWSESREMIFGKLCQKIYDICITSKHNLQLILEYFPAILQEMILFGPNCELSVKESNKLRAAICAKLQLKARVALYDDFGVVPLEEMEKLKQFCALINKQKRSLELFFKRLPRKNIGECFAFGN